MSFEDIQAEVSLLMTQMQNEPHDRHEVYNQLMEKIGELRAFGLPIPEDLQRFEAALEAEFAQELRDKHHPPKT